MWMTDNAIALMIQQLASSRVQRVRIDMPLNWLLQKPGVITAGYEERLDNFISNCPANIDIICTIGYTPGWASGNPTFTPNQGTNLPWSDVSQFADAVALFVQRYQRIKAWEIWNEPDLDYAWALSTGSPNQRAAAYVAHLAAASPAVKAVNSSALVVGPVISGLTSGPWLQGFYKCRPQGLYDVFSSHVYGDPPNHGTTFPDAVGYSPADLVDAWLGNIWSIMAAHGDALTPTWLTEFGWTTGSGGISVAQLAANIPAFYTALNAKALSVTAADVYSMYNDADTNATAKSYGLMTGAQGSKSAASDPWVAYNSIP